MFFKKSFINFILGWGGLSDQNKSQIIVENQVLYTVQKESQSFSKIWCLISYNLHIVKSFPSSSEKFEPWFGAKMNHDLVWCWTIIWCVLNHDLVKGWGTIRCDIELCFGMRLNHKICSSFGLLSKDWVWGSTTICYEVEQWFDATLSHEFGSIIFCTQE